MRPVSWLLSTILAAAIAFGGWFWFARKPSETAPALATPSPENLAVVEPNASPGASLSHAPSPTPLASVPNVLTIRDEVEDDPHSPPGTFLKFVEEISRRKMAAKSDPSLVPGLAQHLEQVALEGDYLPTRAFALRMMRELAARDPSLKSRLEGLEARLPAPIIELSKK